MQAIGTTHGYGVAWNGKYVRAHRLAYELYRGPIPQSLCVLHRCDIKVCVNPDHLFLGTQQDNMRDMVLKGRINAAPFKNTRSAKITAEAARAIRFDQRNPRIIAAEHGIARNTVYGIKLGRCWKWV